MVRKEYFGKVKYLGASSLTQDFKLATLVIEQEENRCTIKTILKCNPRQIYKAHVISRGGPTPQVRCVATRLIIKSVLSSKEFWELHFIGQQPPSIQGVYQDILKIFKEVASKSTHQSKAEVGLGKKMVVGAIQVDPIPDKDNQKSPKVIPRKADLPWEATTSSIQSNPGSASTSVVFTSVKTMRRTDQDFQSREQADGVDNQNSSDGEELNEARGWCPMNSLSTRFYGSSAANSSIRMTTGPRTKPIERPRQSSGQFSDITKTYSWNHQNHHKALDREPAPRLGFANLGNTCFMNAILQSLFSLDTFSIDLQYLYKHHGRTLPRDSLSYSLSKLMLARQRPQFTSPGKLEHMLRNVKDAISSTAKRFSGSEQHDAHEFLAQVLDQMKEEVIKVTKAEKEKDSDDEVIFCHPAEAAMSQEKYRTTKCSIDSNGKRLSPFGDKVSQAVGGDRRSLSDKKGASPVDKMPMPDTSAILVNPTLANFEFEVVHSFECTNCHDRKEKAEQFHDLSVDMPVNMPSGMRLSLQDALDMFFQKGEITEYSCEKCGEKKTAEITHRFAKLPRILVLHLKRYSYDGQSHKRLEDLQLPRFLTLQDHCDLNTTPHLCHRLTQLSPLKSPLTPGSMKLPVRTPAENSHRRRRSNSNCSENGENEPPKRSPKKVRRSLLPEVGAEAPIIPEKQEDGNSTFDDDMEKALEESRKEVSWEMDVDPYLGDLQKALELSMQEYKAFKKISDHDYQNHQADMLTENNNNTLVKTRDFCGGTDDTEERKVSELTEEEQLKMAISLSMASACGLSPSENSIIMSNTPPDSNGKKSDPRDITAPIFKKPLSVDTRSHLTCVKEAPKKDSKDGMDDGLICESGNNNNQSLNPGNKGTKTGGSATSTRSSPDGSGKSSLSSSPSCSDSASSLSEDHISHALPVMDDSCVENALTCVPKGKADDRSVPSTTSQLTAGRNPIHKAFCSSGRPNGISTSIGTLGCFTPSQQESLLKIYNPTNVLSTLWDTDETEADMRMSDFSMPGLIKLEPVHPEDLSTPESKLTPLMNNMKTEDSGSSGMEFSPDAVEKETVIVKESPNKSALQAELSMDSSDSSPGKYAFENPATPEKKDGKKGREEKENVSPPSSDKFACSEAPVSKETEKKILKHKLRLTEIEKGIFPHSYRLVSIVNHLGTTSGFGHYVSDALDIKKQTWFSYDDREVVKTSEAFVRTRRTSTGYIFFYLSKDIYDDLDSMRPCGTGKELSERLCGTA